MIIVTGHLIVDRTRRPAYVAACQEVVRQARATPGCLDFAVGEDLLEPDRVNVMERWVDREHLERFRTGGPSFAPQEQIREAHVQEFTAEGPRAAGT